MGPGYLRTDPNPKKIDCDPDPCLTRKILLIPRPVQIESGPNVQHCIVSVPDQPGSNLRPNLDWKNFTQTGPVWVILGLVRLGRVVLGWVGSGRAQMFKTALYLDPTRRV